MNRITKGQALVGALTVGSANTLFKIDFATASVNPASIPADSRGATTFTVTGAKVTDIIVVNPPADLEDDLLFVGAAITADDTATIYLYNPTASGIDGAARTYSYLWVKTTA